MLSFDTKDLSNFIGKHFIFTYKNGWNYELYIKNKEQIDYRVHSGIISNHWMKNQNIYIARIAKNTCKISWVEQTGINVSIIINLEDKFYQGTLFFPRWIINNPEKVAEFKNSKIPLIEFYREAGPIYPIEILDEFATITFIEDCGINDESVIACSAGELSKETLMRLKSLI